MGLIDRLKIFEIELIMKRIKSIIETIMEV